MKDLTGDVKDSSIKIYDYQDQQMTNSDSFYRDLINDLVFARLLDESPSFDISISLELPTSQGFAMSAAGLIAVALACRQYSNQGKNRISGYVIE